MVAGIFCKAYSGAVTLEIEETECRKSVAGNHLDESFFRTVAARNSANFLIVSNQPFYLIQ